ncbi:MAG: hypothetical protein JW760_11195 [Spirochaetales bacterium]|nr:hypothetical protein [Spirochaetales bacterium]
MNKKIFFFAYFLGFFLCFPSILSGEDYYRSNALGMPLEEIPSFRTDDFEFFLLVEEEETKEVRRLFSGSEELKKWIFLYLPDGEIHETEEQGTERIFRIKKEGRVLSERVEEGGELLENRVFFYDDTGLFKKEISGPEGLLYTDHFDRAGDGRLRKVKRAYADGRVALSHFITGSSGPVEEIYRDGDNETLFRYKNGVLRMEEIRVKDELISKTEFFPEERLSRTEDYGSDEIILRKTDKDDRVLWETIESPEGLARKDYQWDGDLLMVETRRAEGVLERWEYGYTPEGALAFKMYYRGKILRNKRIFQDDENYYDLVFRDGEPLLKVYYENHVQVRTEYLQDVEETVQ